MVWGLTAVQCFFIVVIVFGIAGIVRGWRREAISTLFILGAIIFVAFTRANLAQFFFENIPHALSDLATGTSSAPSVPIPPSDTRSTLAIVLFFIAVVALGYIISNKAMPKATTPAGHILGVIPGVVAGCAILYFVTSALGTSSLVSFDITPPDQSVIGSNLLVIFLIVLAAIIISLIAVSTKKKGGASPKH